MKIIVEADSIEELKKLLAQLISKSAAEDFQEIDILGLNVRLRKQLTQEGITTIDQLQKMSDMDLLRITNLGRKSLNEIRSALYARTLQNLPSQ